MKLLRTIIFYYALLLLDCMAYFYPPMFWHKDNCGFRRLLDIKDPNVTKEFFMKVVPYNGMNVVCPNDVAINNWLKDGEPWDWTFNENIWLVDKEGYDKCEVNEKGDPKFNRLLMVCDNPSKMKYKLFAFHPRYNHEEPRFAPGQDYFFISTSRGYRKDLSTRKVGGPQGNCQRYHMKMRIHVCDPKIEDCIWEMPQCDPPAELYREMIMIDGKLPAPTKPSTVATKPRITTKIVTKEKTTRRPPTTPRQLNAKIEKIKGVNPTKQPICQKRETGSKVNLVLNFVLGGVALFMLVVIIILAVGLSRKSKGYQMDRPSSTASSHPEPKYAYVETLRYGDIQPQAIPLQSRPPLGSPQSDYLVYARTPVLVENPYQRTPHSSEAHVFRFPTLSREHSRSVTQDPPRPDSDEQPTPI